MLLALHHHPRRAPASSSSPLATALLALAGAVLSWPGRVLRHRHLMGQIAGLSDYELRDIGLSRQDVMDAGATPAGHDPSVLLTMRAAERRASGRRG